MNTENIYTEQVEDLKRQWLDDPNWDIEDTEGFEVYRMELKIFRLEAELAAARQQIARYRQFFRDFEELSKRK